LNEVKVIDIVPTAWEDVCSADGELIDRVWTECMEVVDGEVTVSIERLEDEDRRNRLVDTVRGGERLQVGH
jgi:DNA-binding winged helix-turn-helix (wHTH) protein